MNPIIAQLIGEARAASGPGGFGVFPPPPHPTEVSPVQAVTGQGHASEEKAEIRIGTEILRSCVPIENGLPAAGEALQRIKNAAHELLRIHGV